MIIIAIDIVIECVPSAHPSMPMEPNNNFDGIPFQFTRLFVRFAYEGCAWWVEQQHVYIHFCTLLQFQPFRIDVFWFGYLRIVPHPIPSARTTLEWVSIEIILMWTRSTYQLGRHQFVSRSFFFLSSTLSLLHPIYRSVYFSLCPSFSLPAWQIKCSTIEYNELITNNSFHNWLCVCVCLWTRA